MDESAFVRVHDNHFLPAKKRLNMTATPQMFGEEVKSREDQCSAVLSLMDDEQKFGPVFYRLGFGKALEANLLTDYKVMVLVVTEEQIASPSPGHDGPVMPRLWQIRHL